MKSGKERAAQSRIDGAHLDRLQQAEAAPGGVRAAGHLVGDGDLARGAQQGQRPGRPEADPGNALADLLPQFAGAKGGVEFVVRAPGYPHQAEIAHRGAAGLGLAFELHDGVAAFDGFPCVGGAQHAATHNGHPHRY